MSPINSDKIWNEFLIIFLAVVFFYISTFFFKKQMGSLISTDATAKYNVNREEGISYY